MLSDDRLVGELWAWGVPFVGGRVETGTERLSGQELLAGLAASPDARIQLAIIPLLLRHPRLGVALQSAADRLAGQARIRLMCYGAAAALMQEAHGPRLRAVGCGPERIADVFSAELDLPATGDLEARIDALAQRQADLSGRDLNWRATYEHAAERLMARLARKAAWVA